MGCVTLDDPAMGKLYQFFYIKDTEVRDFFTSSERSDFEE